MVTVTSSGSILLGCHVSVQGGLFRAFERGTAAGCTAIQIFTRNQRQWHAPPLVPEQVQAFRDRKGRHGEIRAVLAHGSYLVNPATDGVKKPDLLKLSRETMLDELHRCDALGIPFLIVHPGSHGGAGELIGVGRVQRFLRDAMGQFSGSTMLLIETTSGQGTGMGCRFEHIRDIMGGVDDRRIGVCIDTCHIYGAGYDVRTRSSYTRTFRRFDSVVGLVHLKAIHLNDAKGGLGSRVDRHHHIGMGELGMKPFSLIMNDDRFAPLPKILETPKKRDGIDMDGKNIALLKNLVR